MENLTDKYAGRKFVFFSPFQHTPGFKDGEQGVLVKHLQWTDVGIDPETEDMWLARNSRGEERHIWGGEAYDPDTREPVIGEHSFTNFSPPRFFMKPKKLFRTTVVVWTEYPTDNVEIEDLAREATSGEGYCETQRCEEVTDPEKFPDTEFFNLD